MFLPEEKVAAIAAALDEGAPIEARTESGQTPLIIAARFRFLATVILLLNRGGNPNAVAHGSSPGTALGHAAAAGDQEMVATLLRQGADPDLKDRSGTTPLMHAAQMDAVEVVRLLLDHDARIEERRGAGWKLAVGGGTTGDTALIIASAYGRTRTVRFLLKRGANMNVRGAGGKTPLIAAATGPFGKPSTIRTLLIHGADLKAGDDRGRDALRAARARGDRPIARILVDANAKLQ